MRCINQSVYILKLVTDSLLNLLSRSGIRAGSQLQVIRGHFDGYEEIIFKKKSEIHHNCEINEGPTLICLLLIGKCKAITFSVIVDEVRGKGSGRWSCPVATSLSFSKRYLFLRSL
jgi:hypothetical protein